MNPDNVLTAKIVTVSTKGIILRPLSARQGCQRCAEGKGCGNYPWFQGFFRANTLFLPITNGTWHENEQVALTLRPAAANWLAALTYGVPLLAFFLGLIVSQNAPEGVQILLAGGALLVAVGGIRPVQRWLLGRWLEIAPSTPPEPQRAMCVPRH